MKLVLSPSIDDARLDKIRAAAGPSMQVENNDPLHHVRDADAFFGKITPELLAGATKLRWVQAPTVSLEHYVFPALIDHPCVLTNMRGLFSDVIADQVMGYVICFARNLHRYVLQQAQGIWSPIGGETERVTFGVGPAHVTGIDRAHLQLSDHTMGIVGLGAIGSEIARRAHAFGMSVLAVDPVAPDAWRMERLPELLRISDFVVIAAPHTPQTEKLFCRPLFQQMKRTAIFINIGRGAIVDLADLVAALQANELAGAALDVFETEPLPAASPLWRMNDRVILTPHVAGYSPRIAERHLALLLDNVGRFVRGEALVNVVNKAAWF